MSLHFYLVTEKCKLCGRSEQAYSANITHNLISMADKAEIYKLLWHPEEKGVKFAKYLIKPLSKAIKMMEKNPDEFIKLNPPNGWGSYKEFLPWLKELLEKCKQYPESEIEVSI